MRPTLMITVIAVCLLCTQAPLHAQLDRGYTVDEMLAAYEAGQFRVIHTNGTWLAASPDGKHVIAFGDGIYRVSDGTFLAEFDRIRLSSNRTYFIHNYSVYRFSDQVEIVDTPFNAYSQVVFSPDERYVGVQNDGIYRLSDGQRIIAIESAPAEHIRFSSDKSLVALFDGIYRLRDGQKVLDARMPNFSFDSAYAWSDGVYRLSDGQRLFDVDSEHGVFFTPDMAYAVIFENGVYRLSDGQRLYDLDRQVPNLSYPVFSPDNQYMAIDQMGIFRISTGEKLFDFEDYDSGNRTYVLFSPDSQLVAIGVGYDGVYRLNDKTRLFEVSGINSSSRFSPDGAYLAADWVHRVADGQILFDQSGRRARFSPNSDYVVFNYRGVYRLSDQRKLFDIEGLVIGFPHDGAYLNIGFQDSDPSVYRMRDENQYRGLTVLHASAGIMAIGNTVLVIDPIQQGQRWPVVYFDADRTELYENPGGEVNFDNVRSRQYAVVRATENGWYQVNVFGKAGWLPPDTTAQFFIIPH